MNGSDSLTERFILEMEKKIVNGEYDINTMLPSFRKLCDEYNVSRSVINTAVAVLNTKGFVDIIPRKGVRVRNWKKQGTLLTMNSAIALGKLEPETVDSFFDIFAFIQCNGVYEAASKATEEELIQLGKIIEQEALLKDEKKLAALYHEFYKKIADISGNMAYSQVFMSLEQAIYAISDIYVPDASAKQQCMKMHNNIYQALKVRDGQKARWEMQALSDHLKVLVEYKTSNLKRK